MDSHINGRRIASFVGLIAGVCVVFPAVPPLAQDAQAATSPCGTAQVFITPDLSGNGHSDVVEMRNNGDLLLHPGRGTGAVANPKVLGAGFTGWMPYFPGDWDRDGKNDMIAINPTTGIMMLYPGDGKGGFTTARQIGNGWQGYKVIPAGDLNGDGSPDLLAIKNSNGNLYLYAGDGRGGFKFPYPKVGYGWKGFDLYAASDVNRDGNADILSIDGKGNLYLYAGKGNGTFKKKVQVGNGWKGFKLAAGADMNGDLMADIVSVSAAGVLYYYQAKGGGLFAKKIQIGTGFRTNTTCPDPRKWYYLSDLEPVEMTLSNWDFKGAFPVNGKWYTSSIRLWSAGSRDYLAYNLGRNCDLFKATVGIDDRAGSGSKAQLLGDVTADSKRIWQVNKPIKFGTSTSLSLGVDRVLRLEIGTTRLAPWNDLDDLVFGDARVRCTEPPGS